MKKYCVPQAEVINFDRDYVLTTTAPSTGGSSEQVTSAQETDCTGADVIVYTSEGF